MLPLPLLFAIPVVIVLVRSRRASSSSGSSVIDARSTDEGQQNRNGCFDDSEELARNRRMHLRGHGRWRHGVVAPIGFVARPGVPAHMLEPGTCAEYEGSGGRWYLCCKHTDGHYTCDLLRFGDPTVDPLATGPWLARNRRHGHIGPRPAMRVWQHWPLAPWALPAQAAGSWSDVPPPLGCTIVTGKRPRQLSRGECAVYDHRGTSFICVRDDAGHLRCMSKINYLRQPAFHA